MRRLLALLIGTVLSVSIWASGAHADETYPNRPIRLIIPFPPAGISDLSGRLVAEGLRQKLGQPIIVDNRPGANGVVGMREFMQTKPDGYTLMIGNVGSLVLNYAIDSSAPFDPRKDVVPIAGTSEFATTMVVHPKVPTKTLGEFIAYAKERPGQLSYGSTGVGSLANLSTELFMRQAGIKMVHVPYRGGPAATNDLIGGQIDLIIEVSPVVQEHVRSGKLKALAVTSPYRQSGLPDVPTFDEAGLDGMVVTGWLGVYGPAGLPDAIRDKLGAAIVEIVKDPAMVKRFRAIAFEPTGQGVKEFTAHHNSEVERWLSFYTNAGLRK